MSRIDTVIAGDLRALGDNSRRDVPALDASLRTTDAYRDDRPGAEARRSALAEEHRRELVLMPLTLAHVFAHRLGRIAAGGMAIAVSLAMLMMIADPLLMRLAAWIVPGLNVGTLILIAALAIVCSYVIASWIGEAWFARRMREAIAAASAHTGRDLEEVAQGPIDIAQRAVRRIDGWSVGLFLAGATSVTLVFGYTMMVVGMNHSIVNAWSMVGILETGALERNVGILMLAVVASGGVAFALGHAVARESTITPAAITRALGSWMALVVAGVIGIVMLYNTFHLVVGFRPRRLPTEEMRYGLAVGATISVLLPLAWGLLFWRRREQARLGG